MLIRSVVNWMVEQKTCWKWEWTVKKYAYVAVATYGYVVSEELSKYGPDPLNAPDIFLGSLFVAACWPLVWSVKFFGLFM